MMIIVGLVSSSSGKHSQPSAANELLGTYLKDDEKQIAVSLFQVITR
jgi:hypothetical protein